MTQPAKQDWVKMAMFSLLGEAGWVVQFHVASVCVAGVLAPLQIFLPRRDRLHKTLGYVWVIAMAAVALSSFWISHLRQIGPFSAIHLLSVYVLYSLWISLRAARQGDIEQHSKTLRSLAFWSLAGAGLFALLPHRLMNQIFFPGAAELGLYLVLIGAAGMITTVYLRRKRG